MSNINSVAHQGATTDTPRRRKAAALKRRMTEQRVRALAVARACGYDTRSAVVRWRAGTSWPYTAVEARLEHFLGVPRGFFGHIGEGLDYTKACLLPASPSGERDAHQQRTEAFVKEMLEVIRKYLAAENLRGVVKEFHKYATSTDYALTPHDRRVP